MHNWQKFEMIGSNGSSTNESSIVIGMKRNGRYFRWFRIPDNGLNSTVWYDAPGTPGRFKVDTAAPLLATPFNALGY